MARYQVYAPPLVWGNWTGVINHFGDPNSFTIEVSNDIGIAVVGQVRYYRQGDTIGFPYNEDFHSKVAVNLPLSIQTVEVRLKSLSTGVSCWVDVPGLRFLEHDKAKKDIESIPLSKLTELGRLLEIDRVFRSRFKEAPIETMNEIGVNLTPETISVLKSPDAKIVADLFFDAKGLVDPASIFVMGLVTVMVIKALEKEEK